VPERGTSRAAADGARPFATQAPLRPPNVLRAGTSRAPKRRSQSLKAWAIENCQLQMFNLNEEEDRIEVARKYSTEAKAETKQAEGPAIRQTGMLRYAKHLLAGYLQLITPVRSVPPFIAPQRHRVNYFCYVLEVFDKPFHLLVPGDIVWGSEDRGGVNGGGDVGRQG